MKKIIWIIAILVTIVSCQKEEEFSYPLINTGEVTDITSDGVVFNAKIVDLGKDDIVMYGFVWSSNVNPTIENAEKIIIRESPKIGLISEHISTAMQVDVKYYAKAFIKNSNYTTYGKVVSFTSLGSLGPQIIDFSPKSGNLGDTLIIQGKNFSYVPLNNEVLIGQYRATVIEASQDTLVVIVPNKLNNESSSLSVSVCKNKTIAQSKFQLIKQSVSAFSPKSAPFGSTVIIDGNNFNPNINGLSVYFGDFKATIKNVTNNQIEVYIPPELNLEKCQVKVKMNNFTAGFNEYFSIILPQIYDFYPHITTFGSNVQISGSLLDSNKEHTVVYVGKLKAEIKEISPSKITFKIPGNLNVRNSSLSIKVNGMEVLANGKLTIEALELSSFSPQIQSAGDTITIIGNNFSPITSNNIVMIGNVKGNVINASINSLNVVLPRQDVAIYASRESVLSVEVLGDKKIFSNYLIINDRWFRHKNSPVNFIGSFYTTVNNKLYFGINEGKGFWEYNPITDEYKRLNIFPGNNRSGGNGFSINDRIYYGTGHNNGTNFKDFWEYDIPSNTWVQQSDFSGNARTGSVTFSVSGNGYLGGGVYIQSDKTNYAYDDFWKYNPTIDTWSRIPSFNSTESGSVNGMANGISVVIGELAYIGLGWNNVSISSGQEQRWFVYNSLTNKWDQLASFPQTRKNYNAIAFNLNGTPYVKTVDANFFAYNSSTNSWENIVTNLWPKDISGIGFSIDNIAYVGIGNVLWEYDPSR